MAPPRKCNCGKSSCFTCHRRILTERYRVRHPIENPQPRHAYRKSNGKFAPEPSDDELDRRAMVMMGGGHKMPDKPIERIPAQGGHVPPPQQPATVIHLSATGNYARAIPQSLLDALVDEVESHMKGYGLTRIVVIASAREEAA